MVLTRSIHFYVILCIHQMYDMFVHYIFCGYDEEWNVHSLEWHFGYIIYTTLQIVECGEERYISLTYTELFKVLSEQTLTILTASPQNAIAVKDLGSVYQKSYGHNIYIEDFGATSVEELIGKIPHIAHVSVFGNVCLHWWVKQACVSWCTFPVGHIVWCCFVINWKSSKSSRNTWKGNYS